MNLDHLPTCHQDSLRPQHMLNDDCLTGLIWADLEEALLKIASPVNEALVPDFATALWKQSSFLPEPFNLLNILRAGILLAGPDCSPGLREEPASET